MNVRVDDDGRRSVQAEVEVPGTPEEVWQAISTGPGISAWFVPSAVEERAGGRVTCSFGPGMDSESTITEWQPPHRFSADSRDNMGPGDPTIATEWIVEAQAGGTCIVRVVHSWFTEKDDWDGQFIGHAYGWLSFFRTLKLYLDQFSGQPSAPAQVMGVSQEPKEPAWASLMSQLGIDGPEVGSRVESSGSAPALAGKVAWAGQPAWPEELLIALDKPGHGIAHFVAHPMDQTYLTLRFYFYGDNATEIANQTQTEWQSWIDERFAFAMPAGETN